MSEEVKKQKIPWFKQKTTWAGITAVIAAVAAYMTGQASLFGAIGTALTALTGVFVRQGVEKIKD